MTKSTPQPPSAQPQAPPHPFRPNPAVPVSCAVCGEEQRFHALAAPPQAPLDTEISRQEELGVIFEKLEALCPDVKMFTAANISSVYKQTAERLQEAVAASSPPQDDRYTRLRDWLMTMLETLEAEEFYCSIREFIEVLDEELPLPRLPQESNPG